MAAESCQIAAVALLLLLLPQAVVAPPPPPGDASYWLQLSGLNSDHGLLTEDGKEAGAVFDPQGSKFTLRIPYPEVTAVTLTLYFDLTKYSREDLPILYFDGQQHKFNLIDRVRKTIPLNASWDAFDKTISITLEDPYRPHWFSKFWQWLVTLFRGHRSNKYEVRVMQPPDLGDEPLVSDVILKDAQGARLHKNESLSQSLDSQVFVLPRGKQTATLQVLCSDKANGLFYDQSKVELGSTLPIEFLDGVEERHTAFCKYNDRQWPSVDRTGTVFVKIMQNTDFMEFNFMLTAVSADGYCESDGASGGIVCRVITDKLMFVPRFGDDGARAELVGSDGLTKMYLPNGLPQELIIGGRREEYKVVMRSGSKIRECSVTVIRPAWCVTMKCPVGTTLKGSLKHDKYAQSIACKKETCSAEDAANCCEAAATCNTFSWSCPAGHSLRSDASTARCLGLTCTSADAVRCCQANTMCTTHKCPAQTKLRSDAASIMCNSWQCAEGDSGTCCIGWRSHYVFGWVIGVYKTGSYRIHFDFGLEEDVPAWAVMKFDVFAGKLASGPLVIDDRVEARVNDTMAATLMSLGVSVFGIAVREKLQHYLAVGCGPVPQICMGKAVPRNDNYAVPQAPGPIPVNNIIGQAPYNATLNPEGKRLCYYDPTCRTDPSQIGCKYWGPGFLPQPYLAGQGPEREGWSMSCRACGFDNYPRCPSVPDCTYQDQSLWSQEKTKFCCNTYRIGCPYDCRFGDEAVRTRDGTPIKVTQAEFEGRFKYWTKEQTSWCCEQHGIGCGPHAASFLAGPNTDAIQKKASLSQLGVNAGGAHQRGWPFPLAYNQKGLLLVGFVIAASLTLATAAATRALRQLNGFTRLPQSPADDVRSSFLARRPVMAS